MAINRRYLRFTLQTAALAALAFVVYLVFTEGHAVLVGSVLLLAAAAITGLILDRVDHSRRPPEDRPDDWQKSPEDYWGFRGRPGA